MAPLSGGESTLCAHGFRTNTLSEAWNFLLTPLARSMLIIFRAVHFVGSS